MIVFPKNHCGYFSDHKLLGNFPNDDVESKLDFIALNFAF